MARRQHLSFKVIGYTAACGCSSPNNAINTDVQKRRYAPLLHAGYGKRSYGASRRRNAAVSRGMDFFCYPCNHSGQRFLLFSLLPTVYNAPNQPENRIHD
jgi:hypothetical protein